MFVFFYIQIVCYDQDCAEGLYRNPEPDSETSNGGREKLPFQRKTAGPPR